MLTPSLRSASHAADLVAAATFFVIAPSFQPTQRLWRPETVDALVSVLKDLEAERDALAMLAQVDPLAA